MSKQLHLPIRDNWHDTILEILSLLVMFGFRVVSFICRITGWLYFSKFLVLLFKKRNRAFPTESSKNELVYTSWMTCCQYSENSGFSKIEVDDLSVHYKTQNGKLFVCFYSNNPFYLLDLRKVPTESGFIRRGLLHYIKLFYIVKQRLPTGLPLVFTGHAAGGSIATLFSWFYDSPATVYVYGAYAMGDFEYCETLTAELVAKDIIIHRYVNEHDTLAMFPQNQQAKATPQSFMNYDFPANTVIIKDNPKISVKSKYLPLSITNATPEYYYVAMQSIDEHNQKPKTIFKQ